MGASLACETQHYGERAWPTTDDDELACFGHLYEVGVNSSVCPHCVGNTGLLRHCYCPITFLSFGLQYCRQSLCVERASTLVRARRPACAPLGINVGGQNRKSASSIAIRNHDPRSTPGMVAPQVPTQIIQHKV